MSDQEPSHPNSPAPKRTQLYSQHVELNAKIVDFGGWALPVNYGSQIDEHNAVRNECGIFDVSHMTVSDLTGPDCLAFARILLANNIDKVSSFPGKALYSCMLNESGGVIDDLIAYYISDEHIRLVTNAGTNEKDMLWIQQQASNFNVSFIEKPELALIAVQGPTALALCRTELPGDLAKLTQSLGRFQGGFSGDNFIGRTGYTGEDGIELIIDADTANSVWTSLISKGVQPCGLGARDTLRLESGMSLYGNDLDESHTPLESGLKWTVELESDRNFIGKTALLKTSPNKMVGLILQDRGVLRGHQKVMLNDSEVGEITSGSFSPSLEQSIALARVNQSLAIGSQVQVAVRKKQLNAVVARFPFLKNGRATNSI